MTTQGVDYAALDDAVVRAREQYPQATRFVPLWTPQSERGCVHVEVWTGDRAAIVCAEDLPQITAPVSA